MTRPLVFMPAARLEVIEAQDWYEPSKGSMKGKLKQAGWDNAFLAKLLAQFAHPQMR